MFLAYDVQDITNSVRESLFTHMRIQRKVDANRARQNRQQLFQVSSAPSTSISDSSKGNFHLLSSRAGDQVSISSSAYVSYKDSLAPGTEKAVSSFAAQIPISQEIDEPPVAAPLMSTVSTEAEPSQAPSSPIAVPLIMENEPDEVSWITIISDSTEDGQPSVASQRILEMFQAAAGQETESADAVDKSTETVDNQGILSTGGDNGSPEQLSLSARMTAALVRSQTARIQQQEQAAARLQDEQAAQERLAFTQDKLRLLLENSSSPQTENRIRQALQIEFAPAGTPV